MSYLRRQELLINEIMERQGIDFIEALDIARMVMELDGE